MGVRIFCVDLTWNDPDQSNHNPLTYHFQIHAPCHIPSNIHHWAAVHSCITECQAVDLQLWSPSTVDDPPVLPKKKHTTIFFPVDIWSRDASEGAHQFKTVPLCVIYWCWQALYGRMSCGDVHTVYFVRMQLVRRECFNPVLTYCRTVASLVDFGWPHWSPSSPHRHSLHHHPAGPLSASQCHRTTVWSG